MVEQVVAATEDHAWLQYRRFQFGRSDDFLSCPLRLVVGGSTIRSSTEKAQETYPPDTRAFSSVNDIPRTVHMDGSIRLPTELSVDPGAVSHRVASSKRLRHSAFIGKPCRDQPNALRSENLSRPRTAIEAAGNDDNLMTEVRQGDRQVTANEPRAPGDGDFHRLRLLAKQIAGNDLALNLGRAFVDPRGTDFSIEVLEEMALFERHGAVNLDGDIDHLLRGLRRKQLRHG